ncbi:EF-hand domain-containing protein [Shimia sp. SK013]|uniref:EF-hand domain-containing protein n=1 Tax=Shimia sp. SK013 TaxID=1389006 RepID=UPI0006B5E485|nr:EF-hand domain-containing protein [Shimia sp. SK013]
MCSCLVAGAVAGPVLAEDLSQWSFGTESAITLGDVQSLRIRIFKTFDADGDGALNTDEYTAFDKARAEAAKQSHSSFLLRSVTGMSRGNIDTNLDGMVTRSEMEAALLGWFNSVDKNGDGLITKGEY